MQRLQLIKKILAISLVPSLALANPIGDITEQTGKGALTRNNQEFVAAVDQDILLYKIMTDIITYSFNFINELSKKHNLKLNDNKIINKFRDIKKHNRFNLIHYMKMKHFIAQHM